ncbi:MAG: hypothetical protein JWL81_1365 [Verrucomicrobiales bacterium]|nr:hypothetical protein [Verrucomicrobiales bacterium]
MKVLWGVTGLVLGAAGGYLAGRAAVPRGGVPESAKVRERGISVGSGGGVPKPGAKDNKSTGLVGKGSEGEWTGFLKDVRELTPGRALRKILEERDPVRRLGLMREWSALLKPEEMMEVMKEFKGMMEAQERVGGEEVMGLFLQSLEVIAQGMVDRGAADVLKVLLMQGGGKEGEEKDLAMGLSTQVFKKWAEHDPGAARALLEARLAAGGKMGELEREFSKDLMRAWVKTEPEAAMAWLLKQPEELQQVSIGTTFQSLSHTDPEKALRMVEAQADLPGRGEIAGTIAEWWAKTSPDKALEWARGLPEVLAGRSVRQAMSSWAEKDLAGARQALEGLSGPLRQAALPAVVAHWEKGKWGEAAAFLGAQPAGTGRVEAVGDLVSRWVEADQQGASGWLAGQPAGPERDAGATVLAHEVRETDPEAAAVWGATLSNGEERRDSLKATLREWYGKSVPEALEW